MNIAYESELMENQKHAVVMSPGQAFEVLQSGDGDSLFFSIGTDNILYVTRETSATATGWTMIDLSSALSSNFSGAPVKAKDFCVAQNATTLAIDLALALTVGGVDYLYLSLGNACTDEAFAKGVIWSTVPFDAETAPAPLTIADLFMMNIPGSQGSAVENIFVDVLRNPGNPLHLIDRYYVTPGTSQHWNAHALSADFDAGSIISCLGQRPKDPLPGIYTFGTIVSEQQLNFTQQYNYFNPKLPPAPDRLSPPAGATAIASALDASGTSNLFVSGTDGLFVFAADNQGDQAKPVQILASSVAAGASQLAAATAGSMTSVWGINPQGNLFYTTCAAGTETTASAWSDPVPLLSGVEGFAFFLNLAAGNNVLFAQTSGQSLVQLTQDPITTDWLQREILLPPTGPNDIAVYKSFTTQISITDGAGVAKPNAAVAITATSPVSVYINGMYYRLSPSIAVKTSADATGALTVVQQTQSLAAVCFKVVCSDDPKAMADVNPLSKAIATLGTIQNGSDLSAVQMTNANGTTQPLVPAGVSPGDVDAAAKSISRFVQINSGLPANGSRQTSTSALRAKRDATAAMPAVWSVTFDQTGMRYLEQAAPTGQLGAAIERRDLGAGSGTATIEMAAGDFFRWLGDVADQIVNFTVNEAEGLYHFVATIAGKVYDVLLDCINAVSHAVEFVFNKIKVFFDDLVKWLGFLFVWDDILRTHAVLKNILTLYLEQCIQNIGVLRAGLQTSFTDVQKYIDAWAGVPDNIPSSLRSSALDPSTSSSQPPQGLNSPQGNWAMYHLKSNASNGTTTAQPNSGLLGDIEAILQPLTDALKREKQVLQSAFDSFKADVIDKIHTLSFDELLKAIFAVIADALLESVENVLLAAIDVLTALVVGVVDALTATIDIPVISPIYKGIVGSDLSLMDLTCLVAAVPITVCFKVITGAAPFPDDATTTALTTATSFASLQALCRQDKRVSKVASTRAGVQGRDIVLRADIPTHVNDVIVLTAGIASVVGSVALCIFSPLKQKMPANKVFPVLCGLSYLLYAAPDIVGQLPDLQDKKWWAIFNEVVCDLMVIKATVDMGVALTAVGSAARAGWDPVSPWVDFGGNIVWQVPTCAALFDPENQTTAGILSLWGGTCFDCNGIMSPVVADDSEPVSWGIAVSIATFFNLAYGSMSCASSALSYEA